MLRKKRRKLKEKNNWIKYLDFILIDLICLSIAFVSAYYLKFNNINAFDKQEWSSLFVIICFINLVIMFCVDPYRGITKRRYYLQFRKEIALFGYQVALVCIIFYVLKIGTIFSREMMITTYFIYFVGSQTIKYFYKKIITHELIPVKEKHVKKEDKEKLNKTTDILKIKKKNILQVTVYNFIKRVFDICVGFVGIIILIPLTMAVFVLNRLNDEDGPVFYVQERIGKNGKIFKMLKYRSMCVDADEKLKMILE